jgi:predicted 2-oxoglutarate/Fe(II)-dependent dioxygenase YbiX
MEPQVLVLPRFLEPDACRRIRHAMDTGTAEVSEILEERIQADLEVRRSACIEVDAATLDFLEQRLDSSKPQLERHFGLALASREGASCLRYDAGGFFRPHVDRSDAPAWPDAARRRISLVVFLSTSRQAHRDGSFEGGALRVYGDRPDECLDVHPEAGTLVAFPAGTLHEVLVVHAGIRDSVVDWFY